MTAYGGIPMIGNASGVSSSTSTILQNTVGESVVSRSTSSAYQLSFGFQGPIAASSAWWAVVLGAQGVGGTDATAPAKTSLSALASLSGNSSQDISQITSGLAQNGYSEYKDANGNLKIGGNRWIKFDFENRPIKIITPDGTVTDFVYDFEGNGVKKTITQGGTSTTSTYIGQIYEITPTKSIQYITAGSLRVAMRDNTGTVTYFLPDHLGSTSVMTDASQTIVRNNSYLPFGSLYSTSGTADSDYKFTGQRLDDTTGLYYYGARYYDPALGRFITPDTVIQDPYDPQTLNRYTYCRNNPVIYTDPHDTPRETTSRIQDLA